MKSKTYKGFYIIFEDGRMFSKRYKRFMKPSVSPTGYFYYQGSIDGKKLCMKVHRAVAESFLSNKRSYLEVNHIDGDKSNNHVSNLEWCDRSDNIRHAYRNGLRSAEGVNNIRCNTSEQTVIEICNLLSKGMMPAEVRDMGFDYHLVRKIKSRENWSHVSINYTW